MRDTRQPYPRPSSRRIACRAGIGAVAAGILAVTAIIGASAANAEFALSVVCKTASADQAESCFLFQPNGVRWQ